MGADPTTLERNGFTDRRVCRFSVLSYKVACGSRDIRDIVSACTVWFTLDIPHPYTPCGRGLYRQGLTRLSWVLPSRWLLPCIPHLYLDYITFLVICQDLFEKIPVFFLGFRLHPLLSGSVLLAKSLVEELGNTPWNRTFVETSFRTPLCVLIITHFVLFVKHFFLFFLEGLSSLGLSVLSWNAPSLYLYYSTPCRICQGVLGNFFIYFFSHFSLDILCGVCYNRN